MKLLYFSIEIDVEKRPNFAEIHANSRIFLQTLVEINANESSARRFIRDYINQVLIANGFKYHTLAVE